MKKRYAMMIKIKTEKISDYKKLHAAVWPEVIDIMRHYHIKNYSIYLKNNLLVGYLEYHGNNYTDDMRQLAAHAVIQRWWKLTDPCQEPFQPHQQGDWWTSMEEVFHMD